MKNNYRLTAEELRKSILQLAIQGKLVKQNPNDEPASVLVEKIYEEKRRLIAEGKMKKDKHESYIFKGDDNCYYEKIGNNTPVKLEDLPFDIPDNWTWIRFQNLANFRLGKTPERHNSKYWNNGKYPWFSIADMKEKEIVLHTKEMISEEALFNSFSSQVSPAGTLLMSFKLTLGRVSILGVDAVHNEAIISIFPYLNERNQIRDWLFYTLGLAVNFVEQTDAIKGSTLNKEKMSAMLIPLPPLSEQGRIITKLKTFEPIIAEYATAEEKLSKLEEEFPDKLKKSILQYAIEGKLVKQDPNDEPASVLLEHIKAEKEKLIKEGKIKRDKNESFIYQGDDKNYYENLPQGWSKTTLSTISSIVTKGTTPRGGNVAYIDSGIGFLRAENISGYDKLDKIDLKFIDKQTNDGCLKRSIIKENDILITIAGTLGRTALVRKEDLPLNANQAVSIVRLVNENIMDLKYIIYLLNSPTIQKSLTQQKKITAIPNLTLEIISNCVLPIAPYNQQIKIVSKLDYLFFQLNNPTY